VGAAVTTFTMPCPLFGAERATCAAVEDEVTPTLHERERFCCHDEYAHCPTLRAMLRMRRPLHEREYLALWMPPAPGKDAGSG
jgi:hypothetical protein